MDHLSLAAELAVNTYPGRGIVLGRSEDGKSAVIAYFIMGRSANSRNRVFTAKDGGIITEAADPSKLEDPSLIIYAPGARAGQNNHRDQRRPDGYDIRPPAAGKALPRRCARAPLSRIPPTSRRASRAL